MAKYEIKTPGKLTDSQLRKIKVIASSHIKSVAKDAGEKYNINKFLKIQGEVYYLSRKKTPTIHDKISFSNGLKMLREEISKEGADDNMETVFRHYPTEEEYNKR